MCVGLACLLVSWCVACATAWVVSVGGFVGWLSVGGLVGRSGWSGWSLLVVHLIAFGWLGWSLAAWDLWVGCLVVLDG